ncbi:hypothetical protein [Pseudomonas sp. Pseu.R1]|uniref:hypothetical protein n=1 Tax=Pseudomonas sp. Pseu.R1 TaxID=3379818 RepID=UPI003B924099
MKAIDLWLRIRDRIDSFFRHRALRDLGLRVTPEGTLYRDFHDVLWSEENHSTRIAAYFVIDPAHRQPASPEDIKIMRAALEHPANGVHHGFVERQPNKRMAVVLMPGAAEALGWDEGSRIAFKRLYSGELVARLDKRPRGYPSDLSSPT